MDLPPTIRRLVPLSALAATALFLPSAPAAQTAPGAEDPSGQGSAPAPAFAVRGPAPPDPPEMVRRDEAGGATMRATRLTEPFELDGRLDDAIYDRVPGVGGFIQALPLEGEPATEPTDVWIFYDDEAVYIAGRCWDSQPHRMVATEMRRDNFGIFNNENLAVILDTFYDRRNAFFFYMNPIGGFFDGLIADENPPNRDWTAVWDSRAARFENGWTMEMRIPFKTLRYASGGPQVWGINFRRIVRWKNELSFLTGVPTALGPRAITKISSAGTLVGLEAPASSRTVEVKPYLIGDAAGIRAGAGGLERDYGGDFGVDAKVGITSGLIADLTWNTDFAQVEADAQQINLTRFSLFFPEKREFFLEGQGTFSFGTSSRSPPAGSTRSFGPPSSTPVLFFSRQIGIADGQIVPILGGGRVTGKLGDFGVGALAIRTGGNNAAGAPETDFSVLRLKRDILNRSTVGVMGTYRSHGARGLGRNFAYGMDARFGFFENLTIQSYAAWTQNELEDRTGMSYLGQLEYNGDRYGLKTERLVVGDGFDPGIGFLRRRDFQRNYGEARFSPRPHSISWLRQIGGTGSIDYTTDTAGTLETRILQLRTEVELENGDRLNVDAARPRGAQRRVPAGRGPGDRRGRGSVRLRPRPGRLPGGAAASHLGQLRLPAGGLLLGDPARGGVARTGRGDDALLPRAHRLDELDRPPGRRLRHQPDRVPDQLHALAPQLCRGVPPVQHRREQPLDERALPLGIRTGQRPLRGLQLAAGHPGPRLPRTQHAVLHRQVHPPLPVLSATKRIAVVA